MYVQQNLFTSICVYIKITKIITYQQMQFSATSWSGSFDWATCIEFDFSALISSRRWWPHSIFDFSRHCHKCLLYIRSIFSRCFKERNTQLIRILLKKIFINTNNMLNWKLFLNYLGSGKINDLLCCQITFISYKQFVDVVACVTIDFFKPLFNVIKRLLICTIVNHDYSMCPPIITGCNSPEPFLSCSIPLELVKIAL